MSLLRGRGTSPTHAAQAECTAEPIARAGDIVLIQEQYSSMKPVTLTAGAVVNNRFGRFPHDEIIGRRLGRRLYSTSVSRTGRQSSRGFVHVLAPTPELWAMAMDHRTQIVYPHDSALISLLLELRPGATVIDCGTGSGAACAAFARVVAPGRVHSFDFHEERARAAGVEFARLGLDAIVDVRGGIDVVKDGFVGVPDARADAVFLDLPVPYAMGAELFRVLKRDGRVCLFSPCIEQVQRSCDMLRTGGFHSIRTVTATVKTHETREMKLQTPGFDDLVLEDTDLLNGVRVNGRRCESLDAENDVQPAVKKARVLSGGAVVASEKPFRVRSRTAGAERLAVGAAEGEERHVGRVLRPSIRLHSRPFASMKGHTSYLTFAKKCGQFEAGNKEGEKEDSITNR